MTSYDASTDPQLRPALTASASNYATPSIAEDCRQIIAAEADRGDRLAAEMGSSIEHNRLLLNATSDGAASDGNEA
jgi:hypothetical protein